MPWIKRLDGQCETKVLAVTEDHRVLLQSRWNKGKTQNICFLPEAEFTRRYGYTING